MGCLGLRIAPLLRNSLARLFDVTLVSIRSAMVRCALGHSGKRATLLADPHARPLPQLPQLRPCTTADARRHDRASRQLHRVRSRSPCVRALPPFRSKSQQPVRRTPGRVGQRQGEVQLLRVLRGANGCESHLAGAEQPQNRRPGRVSQPLQGLSQSIPDSWPLARSIGGAGSPRPMAALAQAVNR